MNNDLNTWSAKDILSQVHPSEWHKLLPFVLEEGRAAVGVKKPLAYTFELSAMINAIKKSEMEATR